MPKQPLPYMLTHRCAFYPPSGLMYSMWDSANAFH